MTQNLLEMFGEPRARRFDIEDTAEIRHRGEVVGWVQQRSDRYHAISARGDDLGRFNDAGAAANALLLGRPL